MYVLKKVDPSSSNPCCSRVNCTLLLRKSPWLATGPEWRLNHGPPSSHATWAVHHELGVICPTKSWRWVCTATLHHQIAVEYMWLGFSSSWKDKWITRRIDPNAHGPHTCYTALSLPACTYDYMGSSLWSADRERRLEPGLEMALQVM